MSHIIVLLWSLGVIHAPSAYVDACPQASAAHYCLYYSPTSRRVIAQPTQADCLTLGIGVVLNNLSADVLEECS